MPPLFIQTCAIAAGGIFGALLRAGMTSGAYVLFGRGFPYGTLLVNVAGCGAMGYLFVLFESQGFSPLWRAAILTGLLGAFTTFSAFSIETLLLLNDNAYLKAALNVLLNVSLCLLAAWSGMLMARPS